jgi:hypothetical protein
MICCTKTITTAEILYPMMSSASGAADAKRWSMSKCVIERLKELEPGLYESLKNSDYLALTGLGSNTLAGAASTIGTAATGTGAVQDGINNVKNLPSKPTPQTKAAKISLASSATSSVVGSIANLTKMIPIFEYCNKKWCLKTVPSVWSVNIFKGCKKCPAGSTEMDDADLYPANSPK